MTNPEALRPSNRPAHAGLLWLRLVVALVAVGGAFGLISLGRDEHAPHTPAAFLAEALGAKRAAPLAPVQRGTASARIAAGRLVVETARNERVELAARVAGDRSWQRRAGGEFRATPFGSETITLRTDDPEHFLTVDRRVGRRTWEWTLGTTLSARVLPDGGIGFVDPTTHRVSDLTIAPVEIFDSAGDDVTPAGLRWTLGADGKTLELNLNDASLPEPYVIDPAFRSVSAAASSNNQNTVSPARPTGVLAGDQLLAFISVNAPTATFAVIPPAGWTLIRNERRTTSVALWTFRKQATASEPTPYTFTFQDPTGTNVNKTSRAAVAAYWGIQSSSPIDGSFGSNGGSNRTANVPGVSTTGTNRISVWAVGNSSTRTATQPSINGVASTERIDSVTAAPGLEFADAVEPAAFGPVTVGTGNVLSGNAFWAAQVFSLTPDTTAPTQTLTVNEATNPAGQYYEATAKTHYYNTTAGGTFTVGSVPVDADSGVTSVAFNAVAQTGFTHTLVTDTTSPYASGTYTWTNANTVSPGANRVTVTDRNAQTLSELTITRDITQPTVFTLNAPTGGTFIRNGATVSVATASPTDAGAGMADVSFRACPGSNGCLWADGDAFAVGSDATDQYSVTWPAGQVDGPYQVIARATDKVGNTRDTAAPVSVTLDNTSPSQTLALTAVSQSGGLDQAAKVGATVFYRGTTAGSFAIRSTVSDPGGSGPASVTFGALGGSSTGWTFTGSTAITPGAGTYDSNTYTWASSTSTSPTAGATPTDAVGNSAAAMTLTFTDDSAVPTTGALTVNGTAATGGGSTSTSGGSFSISRTDYTDAGSGIATSTLTRDVAPFTNDGCGTYSGSPTTIVGAPAQSLGIGCYRYVLTGTDAVGNATSVTTVVQVHGAATQIELTGATADLTSGAGRVLTATLRDASGNTVVSDSSSVVTFGQASGAGTVSGTGTATASNGIATKTITGALAGSVTMEATSAGLTTGTLGAFTVVHAAAAQISLTGSTVDLASGANRVLTATIQDAAGNTVTSDSSTVVAFTKVSGAGTVTGTGNATASNGVATKTITGSVVGSVSMEATAVGLITGTLGALTVVHGPAAQISLTGSTVDLTSSANRVLTATLQDAAGNTVSSDSSTVVSFAKASGAGTVSGSGNATVSNGVATKTITGALAGPVSMEATSAGLTTGTLGVFTVVHGAAAQVSLTGSTLDLASGANRVLTATIQDAAGNTVTSDSSTVVAFAKASGAGTVTGTGTATASNGVATKTITGALAGPVSIDATSAGLTTGTVGAFTVVHGAATQIALTGSTTDLTSGASRVLTATIQDAAGNTVLSDDTTVVTFAQSAGTGTVTGTGTATAASGVATKTVTGALVGSVTMDAGAAGLGSDALGAFDVVHGAAAQIELTGATTDLTSGANRVLTATIRDAAGNTVTSDSSTVVAFAKASGAGSATGSGNASASNGVATKTVAGGLAGTVNMEATAAGLADGALSFVVVHGAAAQIALTGSTADLTSGGNRVLTATVQDAAGNTVLSDDTTVVTFAQSAGTGTVTGAGSDTVVDGVAATAVTGGLVGPVTAEATAPGLAAGSLGFAVVHGAAAEIELTGSTADLTSGASRVLTATIKDAAGNVVTGDSSTVVGFAKVGGFGTVTGTGTATAANGVATKSLTGALAGTVNLEASAAGLGSDALSFVVLHGAAAQIELTGATTDLTSGANRVLTATIRDAAGNTVTDSSTVVAFAKASGAGTVTGTGNATAANGVATKAITGALVGAVAMEATAAGLADGTLGAFTIVHGPAAEIELTGATADLTSGANRLLTATLRDAAGNTVTSDSSTVVAFAKSGGSGTLTGLGNETAANGVATATVTGARAGTVNLSASSAGLTAGALSFVVVHGSADRIELTGSTADLASGANRLLTATVQDAAGNTVASDSSTVVAFAKASGAGTITGAGNATAANGVATKVITGALVGTVAMEATAAGLADGTLGAFTIVHGAAAEIDLTGSTADLTSGASRALTATIRDAAGNAVTSDSSTVVAFAQSSGTGTVTGNGNATAASGVATRTVTGALAGPVAMQATAAGLADGTLGTFTVVHGAAAGIALTGPTSDLPAGTNRLLTATIEDAAGNTVTSDSSTVVAFAKASGAGTVTGAGNATAVNGVATKTVTGALVGPVAMEAAATGLVTGTLGSFTVVHGAAAQIELTGSTADLTSGANRVLTATIQDAAGNTVTSDSSTVVAFAKASGAGTVTGTGNAAAANGVATKTVTGGLSGAVAMEATAAGLADGTLGAFTVVHGAATRLELTGSTADLASGANRVLTATVRDAAGNTVTSDSSTVVAFTKASGAGTVTGAGNATAANGVATRTITGELAGPVSMEATAAGLADGTLGVFTVVHGAAAEIELTGSTTNLTSGATRILTATLKDAAGNVATGDSSTVVAFAKSSGAGTVTGAGNATVANGIATKTVTGALVGAVVMEATATGLTTGTLSAFTVVHGAAAQVALTGSTADLASGATRVLTATVQDAAGNTIAGDNSTAIAFAQTGGAGTLIGLGGSEVVNAGVATKTVTGELAGSVDVDATASGLASGTLGFDVVHGPAANVTVTAALTDLASGSTRVVTATVRDAAGNRVAGDNTTVVTFAKDSGAGTVTGLGTDTAAAGVASKTVTGSLAGAVAIGVSAPGLVADSLGFDVVHGTAAAVELTGSTADLASGANRVLTATIRDAAGNTVTSDTSTVVAFAQTGGAGTVTGLGNATAANGVATKAVTGALVGTVAIEATAAGLADGTLGAFTVVPGAAAQIELTGSTADLTSGANRVLTATIRDAAGNTVTSDSSTVVAFAKASGTGTVSDAGTASATNGVSTKTVTGGLAGTVTMEATATGLTTGTLGAFTVVPGAADRIELTHSGSTASGDNHTLTGTILDAAGNTVTADSSTVVSFAKFGGTGTVTGLGSATAAGGVATRVVVNGTSGPIDLDAQAAGLTSGTASYTIGTGSASTVTSTLTASPSSLVANGSSTSAITVQLKDAAGNDLAGSGGVVSLSLVGPGSLSAVTDNGDGTYSATLTSPTSVGSATVMGTLNAAALAATAGVVYSHGPAAQIALGESGSTVAGAGHTLTATIQDANGNTVTSDNATVVAFAKTGGPGTVTGLGTATASGGVATRNVTNMLAGSIDVDAQSAGLAAGTASWTIVVGPVSAAASDSTVVAAPATVYANGSDTATITVTLRDAGGNGVAGKTVTLAQGAGSSAISGGGSTNASGVATFAVSNATVETVTYTATDTTDAIALTDDTAVDFTFQDSTAPTNTITLGSPTRAWLTGTTLYYNGAAGGSFTLSSAVADGGSGPAAAAYPAVVRPGWTHGAESVSTPAGGPYASSTFTFGAGSSGDFTYDITASDAWTPPNTGQTTLNVTEDSTAPAATILCNAAACSAGWYLSSPVSVTLAAPDAGAGLDQIRYTTDGSEPTVFTGTVYSGAFDVAAEGVTTVNYRAFDRIGNDTGVHTQTVRIDTILPETTIDSVPAAATQDTTPTFTFSSPEAGSTFQVRIDGGAWTSQTSPLTLGPLTESTYTFEVRATDVAGNVDASPASVTFTVDTTPADTTITSSPAAATSSTSATFSFTASDAGPGFECRLDGGAFTDCSSPASFTSLTETSHTFEVRAEDAAGNIDPTPSSHTWTVDVTAPDTSFLSTPANPSADPTPSFGTGSTEAPATFECNLDNGGWVACSTPYTSVPLADGSHTLKARATDAAGNTDATEVTTTWLVDATSPTGSITAPANGADIGGTVVLASNSADAGSGLATVVFQRSPAGVGTWTPQAASWDTTGQADGDYDLRVVTTDTAGNSFTSAVITVTVDNTAPSISVVAPNPVNLATTDPATVGATATDTGSGIANVRFDQCAEDSVACVSDSWVLLGVDTGAPYAASWPIPSDGPRLLRVRATDNAGRQQTELVLITIDRIRPSGSLTAPAAGANLRGASVALAATAADTAPGSVNTVTFQRSPAGAGSWTDISTDASAPYAGTLDTTGLADGLYDLRVFTTDAAGNAEAAPATIQVRVDNTLPTGSLTAPAGGANVRGTIALTSNSADAGSGVATVQFQRSPTGAGTWTTEAASFDTTSVGDGQYDLRVVTTDNAGNASTSATVTIRIDNTLPTGSLTAPAAGAEIGVPPVALTGNSADAGSGVASVVFERSPAGAGTWTATASTWDTASGPDAVADGGYDLRVATTDNAGNVFTSAVVTVLVDHTAPVTTASLAPGSPSNAPVTVGFNANDGSGSGVSVTSYRVDGGSLLQGAAVVIPAPGDHSNDGAHVVEFLSTDDVGNVEPLKNVTVVIDTTAPSGAGGDPGDYLRGIANLSYATVAGDVSSVQFQFSPAGAGAWSNAGAADISPPYEASWNTASVADGPYDLRAVVTDTTGNVANTLLPGLPKTVDNAAPIGSITAPLAGAYVSGVISVDATATDSPSGVAAVRFEVKPSGAGAYSIFGTQTAPAVGSTYVQALTTTTLAEGPAELRVVVTDVAGNETTSAPTAVNVDNLAPAVTLDDPGAAVGASATLTASASADTTDVTFRYRPVGAAGPGTAIGSDTTAPFATTWTTPPAAEQQWELIAVATDGGGNVTTSAPRLVLVDRTQPAGSVTAPATAATVGGPAVALGASASDTGGSGVVLVEWQVKPFGSGAFATVANDNAAPYTAAWDSTTAPDGATEIRALLTDAAGNTRTTAVVPVTVDSTGPSVTLADPGAVLSGTVTLGATTGGAAVRVQFAVSPADAGTWTQIAEDASAPFTAPFDTALLGDGLYDLRAIGFDGLGNPSAASIREDVRLDNTAPQLVSSAPADGSASTSASQIVLTASEPVTAPGALLDGAPAPAPSISGNELTFATGALADGLHVLSGELEDASGTRTPFRVAVTIETTPSSDPPPVERSITSSGDWTLTAPGGLVTVRVPQAAWPTPPTPQDYILVLRVDAGPGGAGFAPGTQIADVTARWALAGTNVTEFNAPIEIVFTNPSGTPAIPAWSSTGVSAWNTMGALDGSALPAAQRDGFFRDAAGVHVLTRHLTHFGLLLDTEAPSSPRDLAGVVRDDGLTLRWIPGSDASGQLGNVVLYVNGESYREFEPTQFEVKLGAFAPGDTRTFTMAQRDAAGNLSAQTAPLRAVPQLAGRSLDEARAALGAAGFTLGTVRETTVTTAPPGTVVEPAGILLALASAPIDLVVVRSSVSPQTRLAFSVVSSKRIVLRKKTTVAVRISLTKPANVTVTLRNAKNQRVHTWNVKAKAGANVIKLRLPAKVRRLGSYSLRWVARSGAETISRTIKLTLVAPKPAPAKPKPGKIEVVLAGETPPGDALEARQTVRPRRITSAADPQEAFETIAASSRDVDVVVVDADALGTRFIADLVAVFPRTQVIAISREPARRTMAIKAGAVLALPRSTTAAQLAKSIALVATR